MNNADMLNQQLSNIIALYDSGGDPNKIMQQMLGKHPQINQMQTQLQNMSQGKTPSDFILQLAKQNGVSESNLQGLARILNARH